MSAEPIMEPVMTQQDPIDLLIAIEEASVAPVRPEYVEGMAIVPPRPNDHQTSTSAGAGRPNSTSPTAEPTKAGIRST